jgi:hypothetical protein
MIFLENQYLLFRIMLERTPLLNGLMQRALFPCFQAGPYPETAQYFRAACSGGIAEEAKDCYGSRHGETFRQPRL